MKQASDVFNCQLSAQSPGQPAAGGAGGDVALGVSHGLLQALDAPVDFRGAAVCGAVVCGAVVWGAVGVVLAVPVLVVLATSGISPFSCSRHQALLQPPLKPATIFPRVLPSGSLFLI